jgi:hypothetical protein
MKYAKSFGAIVLLASFCSFAGIELRVSGGLNLSGETYSGDFKLPDNFKQKMHVGFNIGASGAFYFTQQLGVVAGLGYETRGSGWKVDETEADFALNYLQIPAHFAFRPVPALTIALGPELGIFLSGNANVNGEKVDLDPIKPIDLGASLTVDYTFINMIAVGAGYYLGILNNDDRPRGDFVKGSITNNNIKIYIAFILPIKKLFGF